LRPKSASNNLLKKGFEVSRWATKTRLHRARKRPQPVISRIEIPQRARLRRM
jgi:hypothetical protein